MSGRSDGDSPEKTGSIADTESWLHSGNEGPSPFAISSNKDGSDLDDESLSSTGSATIQGAHSVSVTAQVPNTQDESGHGVSGNNELLQVPESARRLRIRNLTTPAKDDRSFIRGRLVIVSEEDHGIYVYLDGPLLALGRGRDADIMILDEGASRLHARLVRHDEGFRIVDAGSGNGTYLNHRKIREAELYDGDVISIGQTRLEYESIGWRRRLVDRPSVVQAVLVGQSAMAGEPQLLWPKMLISALTAFLTMMVFGLLDAPDAANSAEIANGWFERAKVSSEKGNWDDARDELEIARVLGLPEGKYTPLVEMVESNMRDLELARMIETSIVSGQPITTIHTLAGRMNPKGPHAGPVSARVREAVNARADRWLRDAKRSIAAGDDDRARILLTGILRSDQSLYAPKSY